MSQLWNTAVQDELSVRWALGLMHFLWQGLLVLLIVAAVMPLLKRRTASVRYAFLTAVMVSFPVLFAITLWTIDSAALSQPTLSATDIPPAAVIASTQEQLASPAPDAAFRAEPQGVAVARRLSVDTHRPAWVPITIGLYTVGFGWCVLRLLTGVLITRRIRKTAIPIAERALLEVVSKMTRRMGLRRVPAIASCARVTVPTVLGVLRPVVLLPATVCTGLTESQLSCILGHELAHLRRHDLLLNLVQRILESVFFFHPAVWYVSRRMTEERESACDDLVVRAGHSSLEYAGTLLHLAELLSGARRPAATALAASGSGMTHLEVRINRLIDPAGSTASGSVGRRRRGGLAIAVLVCLSTACAGMCLPRWQDTKDAGARNRASDADPASGKDLPAGEQTPQDEPQNTLPLQPQDAVKAATTEPDVLKAASDRMAARGAYLARIVYRMLRETVPVEPDEQRLNVAAETIRGAVDVAPDVRRELLNRLSSSLQRARANRVAQEAARTLQQRRAAFLDSEQSLILNRNEEEVRAGTLIETARQRLLDARSGRNKSGFTEAEAAAQEATGTTAASAARQVLLGAEAGQQVFRAEQLKSLRGRLFLDTLGQVERSHVPFPDEPPLTYPAADTWRALTLRRRARWPDRFDRSRNSVAARRIDAALDGPAAPIAGGDTLASVLRSIQDRHGFTIIADKKALREINISSLTEIEVDDELSLSGITLRSALTIVLEHLDGVDERLTWVIRNEVMYITTKSASEENK